ncbi:sigma factor [Micromonospora sp. NPDC050187]|uniref:sigma factor n=1 Tax=Micromonospora sp. NPDC050187 TaxID=3364277 RepID=UPI0037A5D2B4
MDADRPPFEAYVRARTMALPRIAYLLTGDHHLAEDLVQQTFLSVAGRWERLVAEGDPDAYVRKVLYHQHVFWWRRARRITHVSLTGVDRPWPAALPGRAVPGRPAVAGGRTLAGRRPGADRGGRPVHRRAGPVRRRRSGALVPGRAIDPPVRVRPRQ